MDVPDYKRLDPSVPPTLQASSCPSNGIVAFSVEGSNHVSQGNEALIGYPKTYTNLGNGWVSGGGTFIAPCAGLYSFTISFVKDPYYSNGTFNDVYIYISHNGTYKGYAWSGQGNYIARETGTYTVALILNPGDYIQTFAYSAAGYNRNLGLYDFTGYLVRPLGPNTSNAMPSP